MDLGMEGKVALVTGGNSGIGRAIADAFAEEGARVVIAARDVSRGEETVTAIREAGGECTFVATDVSNPDDVKAMVDATIRVYGQLDYAVNNAGIAPQVPFLDTSDEAWSRVMALNLKGTWTCMMNELPPMLERGSGAIVNIASVTGLIGLPNGSIYAASKHGVVGLTKSASAEFVKRGVRINTIAPGLVETPPMMAVIENPEHLALANTMIPSGRLARPDEIASAAVFLASDRASYISGVTLSVDGGWSQH